MKAFDMHNFAFEACILPTESFKEKKVSVSSYDTLANSALHLAGKPAYLGAKTDMHDLFD